MNKTRIAALFALVLVLIGVFAAIFLKSPATWEVTEPEEGFDSPRLAALAKELAAGNRTALHKFWEEMQGKARSLNPLRTIHTLAGSVSCGGVTARPSE